MGVFTIWEQEKATAVLDIAKNFGEANGVKIPYVDFKPLCRRYWHSLSPRSKAERELGWKAEYDIKDMQCVDSWNWQSKSQNGYED